MSASTAGFKSQPRLRVFAGPNGSGKSTIIDEVKTATPYGKPIDFGCYINADEVAEQLRKNKFSFADYGVDATVSAFLDFAIGSGILSHNFTALDLEASFSLTASGNVVLKTRLADERLAQLIARFLREQLLKQQKRFTFETVFSHESNLDIMRRAAAEGYKVYLYFVATESPEINKYRVELRVKQGGHYVDPEKIEPRYYRALNLLAEAADICHQVFFFDNSKNKEEGKQGKTLVAHLRCKGKDRVFNQEVKDLPKWVNKFYLQKRKPKS